MMTNFKQYVYFREALKEKYQSVDESKISISHNNMTCVYGDLVLRGLVFPNKLQTLIDQLDKTKNIEYTFIGQETSKRKWVCDYKQCGRIEFTNEGRAKSKGYYDQNYYQSLCNAKFTLAPCGDFLWTYRFYEAILCRSIPIVYNANEVFDDYNQYHFYYHNQEHIYDENLVELNLKVLCRNLFL